MANAITVEKIKVNLRISHSVLDGEISDEIDACLADLGRVGIEDADETDVQVLNCIKLWCRSKYAEEVSDRADYYERYAEMRSALKSATGYGADDDD